jgi:hypothetical protein
MLIIQSDGILERCWDLGSHDPCLLGRQVKMFCQLNRILHQVDHDPRLLVGRVKKFFGRLNSFRPRANRIHVIFPERTDIVGCLPDMNLSQCVRKVVLECQCDLFG